VARVLFTASLAPLNALIIEATLFAASTGALLTWKFQLPVKSFCELGIRYIKRLKKLNNK
jgi:hypothetical protein